MFDHGSTLRPGRPAPPQSVTETISLGTPSSRNDWTIRTAFLTFWLASENFHHVKYQYINRVETVSNVHANRLRQLLIFL